jgi:hypothetical protein
MPGAGKVCVRGGGGGGGEGMPCPAKTTQTRECGVHAPHPPPNRLPACHSEDVYTCTSSAQNVRSELADAGAAAETG